MKRLYDTLITEHLADYRQMVFLVGARQVGKTTISLNLKSKENNLYYLNWDNDDNKNLILAGPAKIIEHYKLEIASREQIILVFDEIHKYKHWRNFLKGFFDSYGNRFKFVITGSAKLDVFSHGGDSLMGRYFPYRVHPFSVAELIHGTSLLTDLYRMPKKLPKNKFYNLLTYGGFPEPYIKQDKKFYQRWRKLRTKQLFDGDLRDFTRIQEISQIKLLGDIIKNQVGQLVNYSNFAKTLKVANDTITAWIETLSQLYYCFTIKPWHTNVVRSLIKQPKIYLWDWSMVEDIGARYENFIASHLLKAVNYWSDTGLGDFDLFFIRDKEKREVDFLVTKDNKPWFIVEVKSSSNTAISKSLHRFHDKLSTEHAFQVCFDLEYTGVDCFSYSTPVIVSAGDLLSQLV